MLSAAELICVFQLPYIPHAVLEISYLFSHSHIFVYRKGDIVKQPMKKDSFVPKNVPGVGWGGVGWGGSGWGGSCRGGVGWVM